MSTYAVRYTAPLWGKRSGYLVPIPVASTSVTIRRDGVATPIYAGRTKAALSPPLATGVVPINVASGAVGVDVDGNLTVWTEPGGVLDAVVTVDGESVVAPLPTLAVDASEPIPPAAVSEAMLAFGVATQAELDAGLATRAPSTGIAQSAVTNLVSDLAGKQATIPPGTYVAYVGAPGGVDDTAAAQAAHDALPATGGEIRFRPALTDYIVGRVNVTKPNVTVTVPKGATLKRKAGMSSTDRGMFMVLGMQPANLRITGGGTIDMNRAAYANGAANAAIYALRSTHIYVDAHTRVINSSENAFLFRNCAHVYTDPVRIENCFNNGVEWSILPSGSDGASVYGITGVPLPDDEYYEAGGYFQETNDLLNGAGNGCAVVLANGTATGRTPRHIKVRGSYKDNLRDVWFETNAASAYIEDVDVEINSDGALQASVGFVHARRFKVNAIIRNTGTAAPRTGGVEIAAVFVSGADSEGTINAQITDDRASATDYLVNPIRINQATSVVLGDVDIQLAANVAQPTPQTAVYVANVTGVLALGNVKAKITNPSPGTIGISAALFTGTIVWHPSMFEGFGALSSGLTGLTQFGWAPAEVKIDRNLAHTGTQLGFFSKSPESKVAATTDLKAMLATYGLIEDGSATPLDLDGGALTAGSVDASTGDFVVRTTLRGFRSNTSDGADNKRINICAGGAFSDSRGAYIALSGNEESQTGLVDIRAGNVAGAKARIEVLGIERFVADTNGVKLGGSGGKVGLYAATPIVQPARVGQLTDSSGGTSGGATVDAVSDVATAANAIATLVAKVNALEAKLSAGAGGVGVTA